MKRPKQFLSAIFSTVVVRQHHEQRIVFAETDNGKKLFCYNNRRRSKEFVEQNILPALPQDVAVIFVEGKTPKSQYNAASVSGMLYSVKVTKGFPYLLKIVDGKLLYESIHKELYTLLQHNKETGHLRSRISAFYQGSRPV